MIENIIERINEVDIRLISLSISMFRMSSYFIILNVWKRVDSFYLTYMLAEISPPSELLNLIMFIDFVSIISIVDYFLRIESV